MEILYSIGIRINELTNLKTGDIDFNTGFLRVNTPKGGKTYERVVPIGKLVCEFTQKYIKEVRPNVDPHNNKTTIFLSTGGKALTSGLINGSIKRYLFKCGLRNHITCHSFKVSCGTHMLNNDADIRYVQEQLGHKSIISTQIYTRLVPKDLKRVHTLCHSREKQVENASIKITG